MFWECNTNLVPCLKHCPPSPYGNGSLLFSECFSTCTWPDYAICSEKQTTPNLPESTSITTRTSLLTTVPTDSTSSPTIETTTSEIRTTNSNFHPTNRPTIHSTIKPTNFTSLHPTYRSTYHPTDQSTISPPTHRPTHPYV